MGVFFFTCGESLHECLPTKAGRQAGPKKEEYFNIITKKGASFKSISLNCFKAIH